MKELIAYAKAHLGLPYIWGGANPLTGMDCSGFVQWVLESVGMDPQGDQTAQALYDWSLAKSFGSTRAEGALVFYGKSAERIHHVAILINEFQIIEAGGGDSFCTTKEAAAQRGACIRIRPLDHRKDLVGIFMPDYPGWMKLSG